MSLHFSQYQHLACFFCERPQLTCVRRSLLAVLNTHFYHQHLNKIKGIWPPKLRNRTLQLTFPQVLVYICFAGMNAWFHQNALFRRRNQAKRRQSPTKLHNWAKTPAWQGSKPTQKPTWRRWCGEALTRVRAHPGCGRTPLAASRAHSSRCGAFNAPMTVACSAYQKYHTKPSYSSLYKKSSTSHFK
jgi:hypothetical protein